MGEKQEKKIQELTKRVQQAEKMLRSTDSKFGRYRDSVLSRFHFLFTLLVTFGLVATLYGFEGVIDSIPMLADNPYVLLATGIVVLLLTGTLFKKLS